MSRRYPEAVIDKTIRGHHLYAEKWNGEWLIVRCDTFPDLAKQHEGCTDACSLLDEFERRAQAEPREQTKKSTKHARPEEPTLLDMLHDAPDDTHAASLSRVRSRIGETILAFLRERLSTGCPGFVMAELHAYVNARHPGAPASPDRILRDLRQRSLCKYRVVSRRASRYAAEWVVKEGQQREDAA